MKYSKIREVISAREVIMKQLVTTLIWIESEARSQSTKYSCLKSVQVAYLRLLNPANELNVNKNGLESLKLYGIDSF